MITDEMVEAALGSWITHTSPWFGGEDWRTWDAAALWAAAMRRALEAAAALSTPPPADTVPVRVAVAFDADNRPFALAIEPGESDEHVWADLDRDWQAPHRSCIALINAPRPTIPTVAAGVEAV